MVGEFEQHEANRQAKAREQDRADYTAELNEVGDNGRIKRYGLETKQQRLKREKRDKEALTHAAKVSAAYAKLFDNTMQNLRDARNAVYEAQLLASAGLEQAQKLYQEALDNAARLPDGRAVFMDKAGAVYTQDGVLLEGEVLDEIIWRDNSTPWEVMQERDSALVAKQDRKDMADRLDLEVDELEAEAQTIRGHDTPENNERMLEISDRFKAIHKEANTILNKAPEQPEAKQIIPDELPNIPFKNLSR